jgi:hypothetical protein
MALSNGKTHDINGDEFKVLNYFISQDERNEMKRRKEERETAFWIIAPRKKFADLMRPICAGEKKPWSQTCRAIKIEEPRIHVRP